MRTFTLESGVAVPGLPVKQIGNRWHIEGSVIALNSDCMPEIRDGRVVTASFSKPLYRDSHGWSSNRPKLIKNLRDASPVYTLRREKTPNDTAILVMFKGGFWMQSGEDHPVAHRRYGMPSEGVFATVVRMTPGMRLFLSDGHYLVYRHGMDTPEYLTWRQWELEQAKTLTNPVNVTCLTLEQTRLRRSGMQQRCLPGIAVAANTPLGAAIQLGTAECPELLPLFSGKCSDVLRSATIGVVAERVLHYERDNKSRSIPLYGFVPSDDSSEATAHLVRIEGEYFHDSKVLRGAPTHIRWQDDNQYGGQTSLPGSPSAYILNEGDAIGYGTIRSNPIEDRVDPQFVLHVQHGVVHITAYKQWRANDMKERSQEYLDATPFPQATLPNIPSSWMGYRVELDQRHIKGELVGIDGDSVLLKSEWSYGAAPRITRYPAHWVTRMGVPTRKKPAAFQRQVFVEANIRHLVFHETTTEHDLLASNTRAHEIRPVCIVELGTCSKTGEVVLMYGAPKLQEDGSNYLLTEWYQTYHEAEQVWQAFTKRITDSADESVGQALVRHLGLERSHPSRYVR